MKLLLPDKEIYQMGLLAEADCAEIESLHKSYGEDIFYGDSDSARHGFATDVVVARKRAKAQLKRVFKYAIKHGRESLIEALQKEVKDE